MKITKITFFKVPFDGEHENAVRLTNFQAPPDLYLDEHLNMFYKGEVVAQLTRYYDYFTVTCDKTVSENFTSLELPLLCSWNKVRDFNFCAIYIDKQYDSQSLQQYYNYLYFYNITNATLLNQVGSQYLYKFNLRYDALQNNIYYIYHSKYNSNIFCENHNFSCIENNDGYITFADVELPTVPQPPIMRQLDYGIPNYKTRVIWAQVLLNKFPDETTESDFGINYCDGNYCFFPVGIIREDGTIDENVTINYRIAPTTPYAQQLYTKDDLTTVLRSTYTEQVKLTNYPPFEFTFGGGYPTFDFDQAVFKSFSFGEGSVLCIVGGKNVPFNVNVNYDDIIEQPLLSKTVLTDEDLKSAFPEYFKLRNTYRKYITVGGMPTKLDSIFRHLNATFKVEKFPTGILISKTLSDYKTTYIESHTNFEIYENLSNFTLSKEQYDIFMRNQGLSYSTNLEYSIEKNKLSKANAIAGTITGFVQDIATFVGNIINPRASAQQRATSSVAQGASTVGNAISGGIGIAESVLTGNYINDSDIAKIADLENQAPSISLQTTSPLINAQKSNLIRLVEEKCDEKSSFVIAYLHYIQEYGYKVNRYLDIKDDKNDGYYFTYIKTVDSFFPTIPNYIDREEIQRIYNRGLRIWNIDKFEDQLYGDLKPCKNFNTMINNPTNGITEQF